jgi:hypothetical protein
MNKELIIRQLTFLGFVAGTIILFIFNDWVLFEFLDLWQSDSYVHIPPTGLTILQVWLVTKYLHK